MVRAASRTERRDKAKDRAIASAAHAMTADRAVLDSVAKVAVVDKADAATVPLEDVAVAGSQQHSSDPWTTAIAHPTGMWQTVRIVERSRHAIRSKRSRL